MVSPWKRGWQGKNAAADLIVDLLPGGICSKSVDRPGFTVYMGLLNIGQPKGGEWRSLPRRDCGRRFDSGRIAKPESCCVVSVEGGTGKCRFVAEEPGFDVILPLLNVNVRIPLCGLNARYSDTSLREGKYFGKLVIRVADD